MNKIALPLLLIFGLTACQSSDEQPTASGTFEATEVVVSARQPGEILALDVEEGQQVEAGQQVGRIDSLAIVLQQQQLRASLSANDARLLNSDVQIADLPQQLANLQAERQRFAALVADQAAPQKQVDDLDHQMAVIRRQIVARENQLGANNKSLSAQSAAIVAQIAQLDDRLRQCRVVSPATGTVLLRLAEPGETAAPGRPLFKVAQLDHLYLRAYVEAADLTRLRLGQQLEVLADRGADQQATYRGTLTWVSDKAEFTPRTIPTRDERSHQVYAIKVRVPNDGYLKRGMYGEVRLPKAPSAEQ